MNKNINGKWVKYQVKGLDINQRGEPKQKSGKLEASEEHKDVVSASTLAPHSLLAHWRFSLLLMEYSIVLTLLPGVFIIF